MSRTFAQGRAGDHPRMTFECVVEEWNRARLWTGKKGDKQREEEWLFRRDSREWDEWGEKEEEGKGRGVGRG